MQDFQIGDRVKFKDDAKVPFRLRPDSRLIVRQVSPLGAVCLSIEHGGSVWVKGELLEPVEPATTQEEVPA